MMPELPSERGRVTVAAASAKDAATVRSFACSTGATVATDAILTLWTVLTFSVGQLLCSLFVRKLEGARLHAMKPSVPSFCSEFG